MNLSIGIGVPLPSKKESGNSYPNLYETPDSFLLLKRDSYASEEIFSLLFYSTILNRIGVFRRWRTKQNHVLNVTYATQWYEEFPRYYYVRTWLTFIGFMRDVKTNLANILPEMHPWLSRSLFSLGWTLSTEVTKGITWVKELIQ